MSNSTRVITSCSALNTFTGSSKFQSRVDRYSVAHDVDGWKLQSIQNDGSQGPDDPCLFSRWDNGFDPQLTLGWNHDITSTYVQNNTDFDCVVDIPQIRLEDGPGLTDRSKEDLVRAWARTLGAQSTNLKGCLVQGGTIDVQETAQETLNLKPTGQKRGLISVAVLYSVFPKEDGRSGNGPANCAPDLYPCRVKHLCILNQTSGLLGFLMKG